jgi:hypothetical protein
MAEKVTLQLSAAAAAYASQDAPRDGKLQAARGEIAVSWGDLVTLLYFLAHDPDTEVRATAIHTLRAMPEPQLFAVVESAAVHPKILDMLARLHYPKQAIAAKLLSHPSIDSRTAAFLAEKQAETAAETQPVPSPDGVEEAEAVEEADEAMVGNDEVDEVLEENEEVDEESEDFLSKYQLSMKMDVPEKIKVALVGDKEWRTLLIKDPNKLVSASVMKNPRITEAEILAIVSTAIQHDEIIRLICTNKEWVKNYQIRKALVLNCKTPLPAALRFMATLTDKDIAALAKSKNVATVISTQARRQLLNKKRQ